MPSSKVTLEIERNIYMINKNGNEVLDKAIDLHYKILSSLYRSNKFFYKSVFKNSRFTLGSLMITEFYNNKEPTLYDISNFMLSLNLMSKNSISNFFNFLIVTDRIEVKRSVCDARRKKYILTSKFKDETYDLIQSMVYPLSIFYGVSHNTKSQDHFLKSYYKNFSRITNENLFNFNKVDNSNIFITRDAGHKIILSLFCNRMRSSSDIFSTLSISELTDSCGVSRSHVKKILSEAEMVGLVKNSGSEKNISLTKEYLNFTRLYMTHYFAFCMTGVGLSPAPPYKHPPK